MKQTGRSARFLVALPLVLSIGSCALFAYIFSADIELSGASFTLAWDPPVASEDTLPVASYRVYYRVHGLGPWSLLAEVAATDTPEYTATGADLEAGKYEFAVSSVGANGMESDYHASVDSDADPPTGWFLTWSPSD